MEKKIINKILAIVLVCGMLAGLLVPGSAPARAAETTTSAILHWKMKAKIMFGELVI